MATFASSGRNFQQHQNPEFSSFKRDREHRNQSREWITDDEDDGNKHLRFPRQKKIQKKAYNCDADQDDDEACERRLQDMI